MNKIQITEWNKKSIKLIKGKVGAYSIVLKNGEIHYIGSSINLERRLRRFWGNGWQSIAKNGIKFKAVIWFCKTRNESRRLEYDMIQKNNPTMNVVRPNKQYFKYIG